MPDSNEIERKIREMMLDMGDEQLLSCMIESFRLSDERHQRISQSLEEMLEEVDRLLLKIDELEDKGLEEEDEDDELSIR
jgi:hypothetical protein